MKILVLFVIFLGQRHLSSKYKKNNSARVYKSNINKLLEPETIHRDDDLGKPFLPFLLSFAFGNL